jgi:hypothetical protein
MKNLIIATIIIFSFSSCYNRSLPSKETLKQFAKINPNAENIDTNIIKNWNNLFHIYKESIDSSYIDLQSIQLKELVKKPEYSGILCIYTAGAVNDSILFVTEFDPMLEKLDKEGLVHWIEPRERKYIFHTNGDIEIKMGNMVSREENTRDDGTFLKVYLDNTTGLIVSYWVSNYFGQGNTYQITKSGQLKIGSGYESDNSATKTFEILNYDLKLIYSKMRK